MAVSASRHPVFDFERAKLSRYIPCMQTKIFAQGHLLSFTQSVLNGSFLFLSFIQAADWNRKNPARPSGLPGETSQVIAEWRTARGPQWKWKIEALEMAKEVREKRRRVSLGISPAFFLSKSEKSFIWMLWVTLWLYFCVCLSVSVFNL